MNNSQIPVKDYKHLAKSAQSNAVINTDLNAYNARLKALQTFTAGNVPANDLNALKRDLDTVKRDVQDISQSLKTILTALQGIVK